MTSIPVFSRRQIEAAVSPERAVEAVREAFVAYARGEWSMPPKVYVPAYPAGDFRAMPALGAGHALLKWVTSFPGNPAHRLPTVTGIVVLSDASNGMPILNVDQSQTVVVLKRSMNPGFAGIDNPLFLNPKTVMLFGDAKESITNLIAAVKTV